MGLTDSHGKIYAIEQIFPQYFFKTAKAVDFDRSEMEGILSEMERGVDGVIERVLRQLPPDFPDSISGAILDGLKKRSQMIADGSWE